MTEVLNDVCPEHDVCSEPRYLIPESVYRHDHPEVVRYTDYFTDRAQKRGSVFSNIHSTIDSNKNLVLAQKVATIWYEFSKFVPAFIARAVSLVSDPEHQHHLIQIAYDELGAQDKKLIHSALFLDALQQADIGLGEVASLLMIKELLCSLNRALEEATTPSGIIGLLLSFEIIAETNIETVFRGLSVDGAREEILSETLFFKIHRADEVEHIRHSVANFLKFSRTEDAMKEAKVFFDRGIDFWRHFWNEMALQIA